MKRTRGKLVTAFVAATLAVTPVTVSIPSASAVAKPAADVVMLNGFVYTVDEKNRVARAIAIDNGRIRYVGTNRGASRFIGKGTEIVDLGGRMVMPGLHDAHLHPISGGGALLECNLQYAPLTLDEFNNRIQTCLQETADEEPDGWLSVRGWYQQAMKPAGTAVTKEDLDQLSTSRPIIVNGTDGHTSVVNSRALELAGITDSTPDPADGEIERDASGEATGILQDGAQDLVRKHVPPPTREDDLEAAKAALEALAEQGVTTFMDAVATERSMAAFRKLGTRGDLTARAHMAALVELADADRQRAALRRLAGYRERYDGGKVERRPQVRVRNAKIFLDGVIQAPAQTAALHDPYLVPHEDHSHDAEGAEDTASATAGNRGDLYWRQRQLNPVVLKLVRKGWEPHIHAIGDRAVTTALNAFAQVRREKPRADVRLSIAHAELVRPADFERFADLGVVAAMGFQWAKHAPDSTDAVKPYIGPNRFSRYEPEGDLHSAGARVSLGSDWPVDPLDEWFALKVVVTRKAAPESPYAKFGAMHPEQALSVRAAIRAATINGAYQLHQERFTGSLERGKFADLIVLDRNLFRIDPERIANTRVLLTMVGGKPVFVRKGFEELG